MKLALTLLSLVTTVSVFGQADFSGKWKLNAEKSQFDETTRKSAAVNLFVEQKGQTITLQRNENAKETMNINSNSEIEVNTPGFDSSKTKVSMKLAADKKGLVETRLYTYPECETAEVAAKKIRTWTISADQKTLTITDQIETTNGNNYVMLLVYERQ